MAKTWVKCGYVREPRDAILSELECPKCGVVYWKAEEAQRLQEESASVREPPTPEKNPVRLFNPAAMLFRKDQPLSFRMKILAAIFGFIFPVANTLLPPMATPKESLPTLLWEGGLKVELPHKVVVGESLELRVSGHSGKVEIAQAGRKIGSYSISQPYSEGDGRPNRSPTTVLNVPLPGDLDPRQGQLFIEAELTFANFEPT